MSKHVTDAQLIDVLGDLQDKADERFAKSDIVALVETSPAEREHEEGSYLTYNSKIYICTDDIAIGDGLEEETNIEEATLPEGTVIFSDGDSGEYDSGPTSFADATTEKIVELVTAADAGECDLAQDYGWAVGDEREIELGSMAASVVAPDGTTVTVGESHVAQKAVLVLMDTDKFDLVEETPGGRTKSQFVVGLKNSLIERGYMNPSNTNAGSWSQSARRMWCNYVFREALPAEWKPLFKKFKVKTAETYNGSTIKETEDYFALFAEKEIFGAKTCSNEVEANALLQIAYYESSANRIKKNGELDTSSECPWYERSPRGGIASDFCMVYTGGRADDDAASLANGLAPFGCL